MSPATGAYTESCYVSRKRLFRYTSGVLLEVETDERRLTLIRVLSHIDKRDPRVSGHTGSFVILHNRTSWGPSWGLRKVTVGGGGTTRGSSGSSLLPRVCFGRRSVV